MRRRDVGQPRVELQQEVTAISGHAEIADRGAFEPVRFAQLHAAPEPCERAHHAAVGIVRIPQSARRVHLPQRIGERRREPERRLVLGAACVVVPAREMEIAANVVELAGLARQAARERLGLGQRRKRRVRARDQAMTGRDSDQRPAALAGFPRGRERNLVGVDRRLALARFAAQPTTQHVERDDVVGLLGQRRAALGQRERALGLQRRGLRERRVEVRARRLGRFGAIEVLGDEHGIAIAVPLRGGTMQLRAAGARQRRVDAVADQRVREQELVALRKDEKVRDQHVARIVGQLREHRARARAESAGRRPTPPAAPRGRAPAAGPSARARGWRATPAARRPARRRRASAARGTAGCRRNARRTSARTRDDADRKPPANASASFAPSGPRSIVSSGLPCTDARHAAVERIAGDARGEREHRRQRADRARQRGDVIERHLVRPMQILDRRAAPAMPRRRPRARRTTALARPCWRAALSIASYSAPLPSACGRPIDVAQERLLLREPRMPREPLPQRLAAAPRRPIPAARCMRLCATSRTTSRPLAMPKSSTSPVWHANPAARARPRSSPTSRDLPMPASPRTNTVPAGSAGGAARERRGELRQLRDAADERMRTRRLGDVGELDESPGGERRVDALHLRVLDRSAPDDALRRRVHRLVEHGLAGAGELEQPSREVDRVADHRVRTVPGAAQAARDHLARCNADVHGQRLDGDARLPRASRDGSRPRRAPPVSRRRRARPVPRRPPSPSRRCACRCCRRSAPRSRPRRRRTVRASNARPRGRASATSACSRRDRRRGR